MPVDFALDEMMIIEAARQIRDGETVFVGTGMPMVAAMYAQKTHARTCVSSWKPGRFHPRSFPFPSRFPTPRAMHRAAKLGTLREVLGCLLQRGMVDVGFLGGAEIDHFANINSTVHRRLPASQGSLSREAVGPMTSPPTPSGS